MDVQTARNLLIWVAWAVAAALSRGLTPSLMRIGAKRTDPSLAAALFLLAVTACTAGLTVYADTWRTVLTFSAGDWVNVGVCGLMSALTCLCLFTALTGGLAGKVGPVASLYALPVYVASHFLFGAPLGIWKMCCMVLILLGTVLLLSRGTGLSKGLWMIYALIAALTMAGMAVFSKAFVRADMDPTVFHAVRTAIACVAMWIFVPIRGKQRAVKEMSVGAWVALPLAGVAAGAARWADWLVTLRGDAGELAPIAIIGFAAMLLFSRIINKEHMPVSSVFGAILTLMGMFAILMGW